MITELEEFDETDVAIIGGQRAFAIKHSEKIKKESEKRIKDRMNFIKK